LAAYRYHLDSTKDGTIAEPKAETRRVLASPGTLQEGRDRRQGEPHRTHDDRALAYDDLLDLGHEFLNLLDVIYRSGFAEPDRDSLVMSTASSMGLASEA